MKQTPYCSLGALKVSLSRGKLGDDSWDGAPNEPCFAPVPVLVIRKNGNTSKPTHSFSLAWLKWFFTISLCWCRDCGCSFHALPFCFLISAFLLSGCSTSYVRKGDLKAFNSRFIWNTEGFHASINTNGVGSIDIQKSNPDAQTAEAIARGVATGLSPAK